MPEWIFPNPLKPEQPTNPGSAYRRLKVLLKQAGLPNIRFHDLRHTFATHALASGVDVKTLSGILGHTRAAFTLDTYTHTTGDMQRRANFFRSPRTRTVLAGSTIFRVPALVLVSPAVSPPPVSW